MSALCPHFLPPQTAMGLPEFMALGALLIFPTFLIFLLPSSSQSFFFFLLNFIKQELKALNTQWSSLSLTFIPLAMFMVIMILNTTGLIPNFCLPTSHLPTTLTLAFTFWVGGELANMKYQIQKFFAHLSPSGIPFILLPLLSAIELTSQMIRPFVLSLRLTANMVAGHLLLTLSSTINSFMLLSLMFLFFLLLLETAVALIQSYVFAVLHTSYMEEKTSLFFSYFSQLWCLVCN